jgi:hypothetical protein
MKRILASLMICLVGLAYSSPPLEGNQDPMFTIVDSISKNFEKVIVNTTAVSYEKVYQNFDRMYFSVEGTKIFIDTPKTNSGTRLLYNCPLMVPWNFGLINNYKVSLSNKSKSIKNYANIVTTFGNNDILLHIDPGQQKSLVYINYYKA